jgi:hypothetical protein
MTATLLNYQWELGGVVFGADCPVDHESDVSPAYSGRRTDDQANPLADGINMGQEFMDPGVWQFKLFTNCSSEAEALDALAELAVAWRADDIRRLTGAAANTVTTLRYRLADRVRCVFGRPRKFDAPLGVEYLGGNIKITADFQTVDDRYFDDFESYLDVNFREPITGGFTSDFTAPVSTDDTGVTNGPFVFMVGGRLATPTAVDFIGPLDAPGLEIDGEPYIQFNQDIPANTTYTVDARPWVNSVLRSGGGGAAGALSPRSRMPNMQLAPGAHSATLLGSTPTGTGHARIRWRGAYPTV